MYAQLGWCFSWGLFSLNGLALCEWPLRFLHVVCHQLVKIFVMAGRVCVDDGFRYTIDLVKEAMTYLFGDSVCLSDRQLRIDLNVQRDVQHMPDPARARVGDSLDTGDLTHRCKYGRDETRIDRIEEALQDATRGRVDDGEYYYGDNQSGNRVGKGESDGNAN